MKELHIMTKLRTCTALLLLGVALIGCTPPSTGITHTETPLQVEGIFTGLSLEQFFETSWRVLALRHPETILAEGLTDVYEVQEVSLDDYSETYQRDTYRLARAILDSLHGYERSSLTVDQAVSYDIYEWYLQDLVDGEKFIYYDYPATYDMNTSLPEQLILFFTDLHPINNLQDGRDYVTRLNLVGRKMEQILDGLRRREAVGLNPPDFAIQRELYGSLGRLTSTPAIQTPFYTALKVKLDVLKDVEVEEKESLLQEAEEAINQSVLPAYRELEKHLRDLPTNPGEDSGVWRLPDGDEYYSYLLHHFTSTDLTADEVHQLGLDELERIHSAMQTKFNEMGFPKDESLVELFDRVGEEGGHTAGGEVLDAYEQLVSEASLNLDEVFDIHPKAEIVVIPDQYGGYYITGSRDGTRPGAFYAGVGSDGEQTYAMPTLAYHEAIPGHHFQMSITQELEGVPSFRTANLFLANVEGWALYAERLAWELGWYEGNPYGELGFLQAQSFRAARLVVDTGLHSKGWTFGEAQQFFTENTGYADGDTIDPQQQVARYIVWPGQATAYYTGYLKILELRQRAMDQLGDRFDLRKFHHLVLSNGGMPLEILERIIDDSIKDTTIW